MNVLAFNASPRRGGNTELLLDAALKGAGIEARVFELNTMAIEPCQNCGGCDETGLCIIDDDFTEIADAIRKADRIILASPVYFMGLSAQAKILVDRCQSFWCSKFLLKQEAGPKGRKGLALLVGGMKQPAGIDCAAKQATAFMRTISVPEHATLKYTDVDAKGAILSHPSALNEAQEAGAALVRT